MRRFRMIGAAVSVAALLGAAAAAGGTASAATAGVGTTRATTTVLDVALGDNGSLLNVQVVGDNGSANIDPKQGAPSKATSSLSPLNASSSVVPSDPHLNVSLPSVSVSSTGAADNKSLPPISLTTPAGPAISSGTIDPLSLSAAVDAVQGAAAGLTSTVNNLTAVGGLVSVPHVASNLGAAAKPGDADGLRGISTEKQPIKVLNLGAVLQGLGVNPSTLTVTQVSQVLDALQTTVSTGAGNLNGAGLTQLSGLQALLTAPPLSTLLATAPQTLLTDPAVAPVLAAITTAIPNGIPASVTTVGDLQTLLTGAFTNAVNAIAGATLLEVDDLAIGVTTKAADTVQNSLANITATVGTVKVGNQAISGADLTAIAGTVTTTINDVLTKAGLGNLLTVKILDQSKSVGSQSGYTNSLANLTGVHVAIAPLSSLGGGGTAPAGSDTMGTILGSGNVPVLSSSMAALATPLGTTTPLGLGTTVDALSVGAASTFTPTPASNPVPNPPAATPQNGTLATTGAPTQILGLVGLLLLAIVAGLRWLRRPATTN